MRVLAVSLVFLVLAAACAPAASGPRIAGSTSVQPLAEMLSEEYARVSGTRVSIQGGGSTAGVQAVLKGVVSLGAISRNLSPEESGQGLIAHIIGYDVLAIVVHPSNPMQSLTRSQLARIFRREITRWEEAGRHSGLVDLVDREAGSGSREAFRTLVGPTSSRAVVQNSSGAIRVAVMDDPQAIGYVSLGVARMGGVKVIAIDGWRPGDKHYPLVRPISFVTRGQPDGKTAAFLQFALSPTGQRLVREEGLVPVCEPDAPKSRP